jgi:hypothetical protein
MNEAYSRELATLTFDEVDPREALQPAIEAAVRSALPLLNVYLHPSHIQIETPDETDTIRAIPLIPWITQQLEEWYSEPDDIDIEDLTRLSKTLREANDLVSAKLQKLESLAAA